MAIVSADNVGVQASGFNQLHAFRQIGILVGVALSVALGVTVAMWSQSPNYSLLHGNLSSKQMAQVTGVLASSNIEYKLDGVGMVLVPAEKIQEARMKIASQGVSVGGGVGYELLEKEQGFGSSSLIQKARLHRALEGELAQSIGRLSFIEGARVHLAIPKKSAFARKNSKPAASVVLNLLPGRVLDDSQVAGIINMVASSVPELDSEHVTVIDHKGRLLSNTGSNADMMLSSSQFEYTRKLEESYVQRIVAIISPIVGLDGVRAQVVADIDFTSHQQTRESYLPDQKVVRSEQLFEESSQTAGVSGIPGALSNQPPEGGTTNEQALNEEAAGNNSSRVVRNYELDRTISHTRQSPVTLKKLSVAVVVDYRTQTGKKGKVEKIPLSDEEISRITALAKEAVGLNETRGDTINVVNTSFQQPEAVEPLPEPAIWEQPWVWSVAKQALGGLAVLFIAFGVLRPMLNNLANNSKKLKEIEAANIEAQQLQGAASVQLPSGEIVPGLPNQQEGGEQLKVMATDLAKEDPQRVAQVMNTWVAADE